MRILDGLVPIEDVGVHNQLLSPDEALNSNVFAPITANGSSKARD